MTTNVGPTERAQQAASTAAEEGRHVTDVAKEEAQNVASAAADQARSLMDDAMTQVNEQVAGQRDNLVGVLGSLGDDLQSMAQNGSGFAADLARDVGDRARTISRHLDGREPGELLDEVRGFARRQPGTFLLGALVAGVVAGRVFRGAAEGTAGAAVAAEQQKQSSPTPATAPIASPTLSSDPGQLGGPTPAHPPMPPSTPGQPTIEPPGAMP